MAMIVENQNSTRNGAVKSMGSRLIVAGEKPLFLADWDRALFIHFAVAPELLQSIVPFELDLREGRAFVSLVAFTMRRMRPRIGGRFGELLFRTIATHPFLNVRTYVRHGADCGIHFLTEWLPNRLSVALGPRTFALPYRLGEIEYSHRHETGELSGQMNDVTSDAGFSYRATLSQSSKFHQCATGSLDEWLLERYLAFNSTGGRRRCFRVWHDPWPQTSADVRIPDDSLLRRRWSWFEQAEYVGANYSPGLRDVGMGWPRPVKPGRQNEGNHSSGRREELR